MSRTPVSVGAVLLATLTLLACADHEDQPAVASQSRAVTATNGMLINGLAINGLPSNGFLLNGFALNGSPLHGISLVENGMPLQGMPLQGMPLQGMPLQGMPLQGMPLQGMPLQGMPLQGMNLNGLDIQGMPLQGMPLQGMPLQGMPLQGMPLQGMPLQGLYINGLAINGVPLMGLYHSIPYNGMPLQGMPLQGMPLQGMPLQGMPLQGLELYGMPITAEAFADAGITDPTAEEVQAQIESAVCYLVQCALADGDHVTVTAFDGTQRDCGGALGLAPEWKEGALSDEGNALVRQCLLSIDDFDSNADFDDVDVTLAKIPFNWEELELFRTLLKYIAKCAIPEGETIEAVAGDPEWTFPGFMGLAPEWADGPPTPDNARLVSACLGAMTNANGQHVRISLRGPNLNLDPPRIPVTPEEVELFGHHEGGFWADFFSTTPFVRTCSVDPGISGRICSGGSCPGFEHYGDCASTCAMQDGGDNSFNECGDNDPYVLNTFMNLEKTLQFGKEHMCLKTVGGTVWCWGSNSENQLGAGWVSGGWAETPVASLVDSPVEQIASGAYTTCARHRDGRLSCWGGAPLSGYEFEFGDLPVVIEELGSDVASVSVNEERICALTTDGTLWCWGGNTSGSVGNGTQTSQPNPQSVLTDVAAVAQGFSSHPNPYSSNHTCAIRLDGSVWCWGNNASGQLGIGTYDDAATPQAVVVGGAAFDGVTEICTGVGFSCARRADATLWCWGSMERTYPYAPIDLGTEPTQVGSSEVPQGGMICGAGFVCYLGTPVAPDEVTCVGGIAGYLSEPANPAATSAVVSLGASGPFLDEATALFAGWKHACARRTDGTIWCWGDNTWGQLGNESVEGTWSSWAVQNFDAELVPECGVQPAICDPGETVETCPSDCLEVCDGLDNDQDGFTDKNRDGTPLTLPCGTDVGACEFGEKTCVDGEWGPCGGPNLVEPTAEVCDPAEVVGEDRDNDCDWLRDEGLEECEFPTTCGDGLLDFGEECDPGAEGFPCCAADCTWVPGCSAVCGDGFVDWRSEQCESGACCDLTTCQFAAQGSVCGLEPGTCSVGTGTCTGWSAQCGEGDVTAASAGTVCRASAGDCDPAETCDGVSTTCPADSLQAAGTTCRASAGGCDVAESCTGASPACPSDAFAAAGTECRPAASECDMAESCTGADAVCPSNAFAADGTPCAPDGNECTLNTCSSGACSASSVPYGQVCTDDGNPHTLDFCEASVCTHPYGVRGDLLINAGSESPEWTGDLIIIESGAGDVTINGDLTISCP